MYSESCIAGEYKKDSLSYTEPLVSVIIPVYKVEPYLRECVDSVLSQTYTNIEIILVDDGSSDGCPAICDEYAAKDSRVRVIHKENGGLSDARNAGMKIASAEWWTFVDSDDVIHPQMIEMLMKLLLADDLKISAGGFTYFSEVAELRFSEYHTGKVQKLRLKDYICTDLWMTAWGKIYNRSLFSDIEYPKGRLHEDEFVTYKLIYKANEIAVLPIPLYMYRQRGNSIMSNYSEKHLSDAFDALSERMAFFKDDGELYNTAILQMLDFYVGLNSRRYKKLHCKEIKKKAKRKLKKANGKRLEFATKIKRFVKLYFTSAWLLFVEIKASVFGAKNKHSFAG